MEAQVLWETRARPVFHLQSSYDIAIAPGQIHSCVPYRGNDSAQQLFLQARLVLQVVGAWESLLDSTVNMYLIYIKYVQY